MIKIGEMREIGQSELIELAQKQLAEITGLRAKVEELERDARKEILFECSKCAFGFDRRHANKDGSFTCPLCREARLEKALSVMRDTNQSQAVRTAAWSALVDDGKDKPALLGRG